jgi:uncharacterized protein (DUF1778 family)
MVVPEWHQKGSVMQSTIDERARITARVPAELRESLEEAAQLQGATLSQFVVQAASAEARRVLDQESLIRLSRRDAAKVLALLDRLPQPNPRLKDAVRAHRQQVRAST